MAGASVRLRRRLTVAFVLVAVVSTATLTLGAYLLVRQSRFDDSVRRAGADARYQLVLARQFLPLDAAHRASLLASFEVSGRHVVLVTAGGELAPNPAFALVPAPPVQARAAAGQLVYARDDAHQLSVGG